MFATRHVSPATARAERARLLPKRMVIVLAANDASSYDEPEMCQEAIDLGNRMAKEGK